MDAQDSGSRSTAARAFPNSRGLIDELKARCQAHHEHLVSLASYAEALVEACREEARLEARTIVMNARERADALVAESRERADEVLVAARQEADGLRAEAKRLSGAISIAAREQADTTLSDAKAEAERLVADARTRADAILAAAAPLVTAFPSLTAPEPQPLPAASGHPRHHGDAGGNPRAHRIRSGVRTAPAPHTITFLPDMGYERTLEGTEPDEARGPYAPMSLLEQHQNVPERLDGDVVNRPGASWQERVSGGSGHGSRAGRRRRRLLRQLAHAAQRRVGRAPCERRGRTGADRSCRLGVIPGCAPRHDDAGAVGDVSASCSAPHRLLPRRPRRCRSPSPHDAAPGSALERTASRAHQVFCSPATTAC